MDANIDFSQVYTICGGEVKWQHNHPKQLVDFLSTEDKIQLSIVKWETILAELDNYPDHNYFVECGGIKTCPLCIAFYNDGECNNCPIYKKSEESQCCNTPYDRYVNALDNDYNEYYQGVKDEIQFLKDLLQDYELEE